MRVCWRGTLPGGGPALPGVSLVSATAATSAAALPEATTVASAAAMVAFAARAGLARPRAAGAGHGEPGAVHAVTDPLIRVADAVPEEQQYRDQPGGDQRENERILHD